MNPERGLILRNYKKERTAIVVRSAASVFAIGIGQANYVERVSDVSAHYGFGPWAEPTVFATGEI